MKSGRKKQVLTPLQQDEVEFGKLKGEIEAVGMQHLADIGLVARYTIYRYVNKYPVTVKTENLILESIEQYRDSQKLDSKRRADRVTAMVESMDTVLD